MCVGRQRTRVTPAEFVLPCTRVRDGQQLLETFVRVEGLEMRIDPEERPALIAGIGASLEPGNRFVDVPEHGVHAGDLIVRMMRVAE